VGLVETTQKVATQEVQEVKEVMEEHNLLLQQEVQGVEVQVAT
jgi:hypothetical protein